MEASARFLPMQGCQLLFHATKATTWLNTFLEMFIILTCTLTSTHLALGMVGKWDNKVDMYSVPEHSTKVGRNEPCPCGSGKKFKRCHAGMAPPELHSARVDARTRHLLPKPKCFAPTSLSHECTKGTINAHTISRSGSLGEIARDSHVYSYKATLKGLKEANGNFTLRLTGWKEASTFPGFCSHHDKKLFQPLEDAPFTGSKEQCCLLAYRAVAWELYAKLASNSQDSLRYALSFASPEMSKFISMFNFGTDLGLKDAKNHKAAFDSVLEYREWSRVEGVLIEFNCIFPIQCAAAFFPDCDINGKLIQAVGIAPKMPDVICVNSFAADGRSYLCLVWLVEHRTSCAPYTAAITPLSMHQLAPVIGSMLLQRSENCHIAPSWYDSLPSEGKNWCSKQLAVGIGFNSQQLPSIAYSKLKYFEGIEVCQVLEI
jgi:hypothetical protein